VWRAQVGHLGPLEAASAFLDFDPRAHGVLDTWRLFRRGLRRSLPGRLLYLPRCCCPNHSAERTHQRKLTVGRLIDSSGKTTELWKRAGLPPPNTLEFSQPSWCRQTRGPAKTDTESRRDYFQAEARAINIAGNVLNSLIHSRIVVELPHGISFSHGSLQCCCSEVHARDANYPNDVGLPNEVQQYHPPRGRAQTD